MSFYATRATWMGCFQFSHNLICNFEQNYLLGPLQFRFLLLLYLKWAQYGNLIVDNLTATGVKK